MARKAKNSQVEATPAAEVAAMEPKAEDIQTEEKVAESTQEEPKKTPARRRASKKETTKTETVKTAANKTAKTSAKKTECSLYVQYAGRSLSEGDLMKIAKDVWKYDLKQKVRELKNVELYVKPEENKVYYVMNKEFTGSFDI